MRSADLLRLSGGALLSHPLRSALSALGIAVGVAAVILLTALGEGLHTFVIGQFTQFGTHLIGITPGKTRTHGAEVGMFGNTRALTIDDALALRRLPDVLAVSPVVQGNAEVTAEGRARRVSLYGVGPEFEAVFRARIASGRFLPADDQRAPRAFLVLGPKAGSELFGSRNPLGQLVRVGGQRYRVVGVLSPKGQMLGFDLDDTVFIPTARALELFNREGVMEIDVLHRPETPPERVEAELRGLLAARHGGEDFTVTPQKQQLAVLDSVLSVLTFAVAALGSISLAVGGVGILTLMTIAVSERTGEIGLLSALGARRGQIMGLFLGEATGLATLGGLAGLIMGVGLARGLARLVPALPVSLAWDYVLAAELVAVAIGILAGVAPARRAARLDPVEALRAE